MKIEVKGHSGCSVSIEREGKSLFIFKATNDPAYISRLEKQAKKQEEASALEYQHIRIPQIYALQKKENSFTIKMEYVYSKNFMEYFESAGFEQIDYFIKAFIMFVEREINASPIKDIDINVLKNKFDDIKEKISRNELIANDESFRLILDKCDNLIKSIDRICLPVGKCHGDLTFSNILFNGNNYYLIDFLDSFIESPLMDIVKLRQDSAFMWSKLMYIRDFDEIRFKIISKKIDSEIDYHFRKYEWYNEYYNTFQIINFLRILQYAKDEKVVRFLKETLISLTNEI